MTLITILLSASYSFSNEKIQQKKDIKITYIANDGFLIKVNDKTILIDAIFGDKAYEFCDIPDTSILKWMKNAKQEFENVDIIAATHCHNDHFYAPFVSEHLLNNKKGKFISCRQTMEKLADTNDYEAIKPQVIEITPDSLTHQDTVINGIDVRVFRLMHGPYYIEDPETGKRINRHQNIQNLGFLFTIDGVKIFHAGDSSPSCISDYEHFRLDKEKIDIAFLGRGFMWSSDCEGIDVIRKYINPKHIILMHIHHDQNKKFIDIAEALKNEFPSVMIFEKQMESKTYVIN